MMGRRGCELLRSLKPALLMIALTSCGAGGNATAGKDNAVNDSTTVAHFTMTSSDIKDGQPIATVYTCDGANQSPELSWAEPPAGTRSLALIVDDPDAPGGTFYHWGMFNIPANQREVARGAGNGGSNSNFVEAVNGFGNSGYGGPCPPKGHGPHRYRFKLYALDVDKLTLSPNAKIPEVEQQAQQHKIAIAEIIGTYERK
jgi:Raf kinase inhibitor-like YbhB/YbcL family protein